MTALNWLHFTDLHVHQKVHWAWESVRPHVLEDLAELSRQQRARGHGPWDIVFFTGDLASRGSPEEYELLEKELDAIWESIRSPWPDEAPPLLLAVPGNHDLCRPQQGGELYLKLSGSSTTPEKRMEDAGWVKAVQECFQSYSAWWARCRYQPNNQHRGEFKEGLLPGDFSFILRKAGLDWRFVGFNTAFLELEDGKEGKLELHLRQIEKACDHSLHDFIQKSDAAFLLSHHPPSWLNKTSRDHYEKDIYVPGRFLAHLCGHLHVANAQEQRHGQNPDSRTRWQGPSLLGLEPKKDETGFDRQYGYSAGRVELAQDGQHWLIKHWPRVAVERQSGDYRIASDRSFELVGDFLSTREEKVERKRSSRASSTTEGEPIRSHSKPWQMVAAQSRLWAAAGPHDLEDLRKLAESTVETCAAVWTRAQETDKRLLGDDPWHDREYPSRVVERLEEFVGTRPRTLEPAEAFLLVVIPFINEALRDAGWVAMSRALLDNDLHGSTPRGVLERAHRTYSEIKRRADEFSGVERHAIQCWLMHRALDRAPELWNRGVGFKEAAHFVNQFIGQARKHLRWIAWDLIQKLARCVGARSEVLESNNSSHSSKLAGGVLLRETLLEQLLGLAGQTALDIRQADNAAVEHIGLDGQFDLGALKKAVQCARWSVNGDQQVLLYDCDNPVVDFVLRDRVMCAEESLKRIYQPEQTTHDPVFPRTILDTLQIPRRFSATGVRPRTDADGKQLYSPIHIRFRLEHNLVRNLLMGQQLYSDPTLAIRELYQNALDACRRRRSRHLVQGDSHYEGKVVFRQGYEENRPYLECEDNGIGMTVQDLEQLFAVAGRRFVDTPEFQREWADWTNRQIKFSPNSQFGIGVFSYFMVADRIEVITRPVSLVAQPDAEPIRAWIASASGLFHVTRLQDSSLVEEGGSRVRLYLKRLTDENLGLSYLPSVEGVLTQQLWIAEFETVVQENDAQSGAKERRWPAGELIFPPGTRSPVRQAGPEDLWWVHGDGRVLADGIVTEERHPLAIVNLRHEHYPSLSVDRKRILSWSSKKVSEELVQAVEALCDWPELSFDFLWALEEWNWLAARELFRKLQSLKRDLPLRTATGEELRVRVDHLGCFAHDRKLHRGEVLEHEASLSWRVNAWTRSGLPLPGKLDPQRLAPRKKGASTEALAEPGDAALVDVILKATEGRDKTWHSEEEPVPLFVQDALIAALELSREPAEVAERLEKLAPELDFSTKSIQPGLLKNILANRMDPTLLARDFNGQAPWLSGRVLPQHVLAVSQRLNRALREVHGRLEALVTALKLSLEFSVEQLERLEAKPSDLVLLSEDLNGQAPWLSGRVGPHHVLMAAGHLKRPVRELARRLEEFQSICGLTLDFNVVALIQAGTTPDDLPLLSVGLNGRAPWLSGTVPSAHMLAAIVRVKASPEWVVQRLEDLKDAFGLRLNHDVEKLRRVVATPDDLLLLSENLDGQAPWLSGRVSSAHLLTAASRRKQPVAQVARRLTELAGALGLEPGFDAETLARVGEQPSDLRLLSSKFDGQPPWLSGIVPLQHLLSAVRWLNSPLEEVASRVSVLAPPLGLRLGVEVEKLLRAGARLGGRWQLLSEALSKLERPGRMTPHDVLQIAGNLALTVKEVVPGLMDLAPAFELKPDFDAEALVRADVDPGDLRLLSEDLSGRPPWLSRSTVTPTHVLTAASRLERSLGWVVRRLKALARAFELDLGSVERLGQEATERSDIWLLSADTDGQEPWLSGPVSSAHLLSSAFRMQRPVVEVAVRLKRLAAALGLPVEFDVPALERAGERQGDFRLLSKALDGMAPWLSGSVPIQHVLNAALKLERPVEQVASRLKQLAQGLNLRLDPGVDTLMKAGSGPSDLVLLSEDLDGRPPWLYRGISPSRLLMAARKLSGSLSEEVAQRQVLLASALGLTVGFDVETLMKSALEYDTAWLFPEKLKNWAPWLSGHVSVPNFLEAVEQLALPHQEAVRWLEALNGALKLKLDVDLDELRRADVDPDAFRLLAGMLKNWAPRRARRVRPLEVLQVIDRTQRSSEWVIRQLQALCRALNLELDRDVEKLLEAEARPGDVELILGRPTQEEEDAWLVNPGFLPDPYGNHKPWIPQEVPSLLLLGIAEQLGRPLGEVALRLKALAPALGLEPAFNADVLGLTRDDDSRLLLVTLEGDEPWRTGAVLPQHVLRAVLQLGRPLQEVAGTLAMLIPALDLKPDFNVEKLVRVEPEPRDLLLLSKDLDGQAPWLSGPVSPHHVLRAAGHLKSPVEEVARRLEVLLPACGLTLDFNVEKLVHAEPEPGELLLLSAGHDGMAPWLSEDVPLPHLLAAARRLQWTLHKAARRLQALAPAFKLKLDAYVDRLVQTDESGDDLWLLSERLDGTGPWLTETVPVQHVLAAAGRPGRSVETVVRRLMVLAKALDLKLGFEPELLIQAVTEPGDLLLLSEQLDGKEPWRSQRIPFEHAFTAARQLGRPLADVASRLQVLAHAANLDFDEEAFSTLVRAGTQPGDLVLLSRELDGQAPWISGRVSLPHVLSASRRLTRPAREVAQRMQVFAPVLDLSFDFVPSSLQHKDEVASNPAGLAGTGPWT